MYDLVNIFDTFLPQLLLYPNPSDPLNPEAAKLMNDKPEKYINHVKEHVKQHASKKIYLLKMPENLKKPDYNLKDSDKITKKPNKDDSLSELSNASDNQNDDLNDW